MRKSTALMLPLLVGMICAATTAGVAQVATAPAPDLLDRAAKGDVAAPGGARRGSGDRTEAYRALLASGEVRNVILLIGDGMGDSEITLARNYAEGAGGSFKGIDALPFSGQYTHYSLDRTTGKPNYVTDSAASATAWTTGVKSYNGAIGVDVTGQPHATLIELAKAAGLATGNVSTAAIQDATPAAQIAHIALRGCQAPTATSKNCPEAAIENGGLGSISEQLLETRPDVTLGGGMAGFQEIARGGRWKGKSLLAQARTRGFQVVESAEALASVTRADAKKPLLGLFAPENMPVRWTGPIASYHGNIDKPAITCADNPERGPATPALAAMTRKAIDLLRGNPHGFLLQVEGASIDKQNHAANPCGQIGETVDLDEAVQVALEFAKSDGKTLVIVTADHAHSSQIVANGTRAPGLTAALNTREGSVMTVSYGNSEGTAQGHTGTQLRIAAYGPGAANVLGLTDQTDLFYTIRDALRLKEAAEPAKR
ncbi:MAG: alkaline phosphatase [Sphingobium sp.]